MKCYFTVHSKADICQLIYRTESKTKKWEKDKLKSKKTDMLKSIGKQCRKSVESFLKKPAFYSAVTPGWFKTLRYYCSRTF